MSLDIIVIALNIIRSAMIIYFVLTMGKDRKNNDALGMIYHGFWALFLII